MNQRSMDKASAEAVREENAQELREAVYRQWRAGLSDSRIASAVRVRRATVKRVREELGLPANQGGAR